MDNNFNNNINQNSQNIQNGMNYFNNSSPNNFNYQNQSINTNKSTPQNKKSKKNITIIMVIVIIAILGFLGYKFLLNNIDKGKSFDINYSTSFFIKNSDDKYALFNDDGKQLTDFIYTSVSEFLNGTAIVEQYGEVGIISTNGKMTVDFGKYSYIRSTAGIYKVHGEDNHYFLIDGNGKVLYDLEDANIDTFIGKDTYSILEKDNTFSLLNYNGDKIVSFPVVDGVDNPTTNEKEGYISVFYNNKNFILNVNTGKQVASFDSDKHFCVNNVKDNGNLIVLNSCVSWFQSQDVVYYKLIQNGNIISIDAKCESVYFKGEQLICMQEFDEYLLDSNYKIGMEISSKAYLDNNTYAMNKGSSIKSVDFYNNGSFVKNVSCRTLEKTGYMLNGLYILGTYYSENCGTTSGKYEYYKSNGEKAFNKSFLLAKKIDENGYAEVSEDMINHYLIDSSGNQISGLYSRINLSNGYYIVTKDMKYGIINKSGKEVVPCEYSKIEIIEKQNKIYATLKKEDSISIVYDIDNKKEILSINKPISLHEHYIYVENDSKKQYYSYTTGKMFYEE